MSRDESGFLLTETIATGNVRRHTRDNNEVSVDIPEWYITKIGHESLFGVVIASPTLFCRSRLIIPEVFEAVRRHLCVTHRMLDVLVAQIVLNGSGIMPV